MAKVHYIDDNLMESICHRIAVKFFDKKFEPIAPFDSCNRALLDSALHLPKSMFGGTELYPTLAKKAATLYYSLIKNHPFENGNKRIATASLLVFLAINNYWLEINREVLTLKAVDIASSDPKDRAIVLNELENLIHSNITSF